MAGWFPFQAFTGQGGGAPTTVFVDVPNSKVYSFPEPSIGVVDYYFSENSYIDGSNSYLSLVQGEGDTNGVTAAGSAILNFASVPSFVANGMTINDFSTSGAIPPGTTVLSFTGTTVTMTANATGGGVGSGDTIKFGNNFFPVSGNDTPWDDAGAFGTDGNIYINSSLSSATTTAHATCMLSKVDPASKIEVAALQTQLYLQNAAWAGEGPEGYRMAPFALGGVNYLALSQIAIHTGGDKVFEIVNVDTMASVATSTNTLAGGNFSVMVRGPYPNSTSVKFYRLIISQPGLALASVTWDSVGGFTTSAIKTYSVSDFGHPGFVGIEGATSLYYDASDGNVIFMVWLKDSNTPPELNYYYIAKARTSDGTILWTVQTCDYEYDTEFSQLNSTQSDLSQGTLFFAMPTCVTGGKIPPYMLGPNQALGLLIDTSNGSFSTIVSDHSYRRGEHPNNGYWDSTNGKYLFYDSGAGDYSGSFQEGYVIFEPATAGQVSPWTRTVFNPYCTISATNYNYVNAVAASPLQPDEIYVWGYPSGNAPALGANPSTTGPHALAAYTTGTGVLRASTVLDATQINALSWGNTSESTTDDTFDHMVLAPNARALFYYHVGEGNPPSSFTTTRWIQKVDPDTLTLVSASATPSAAGASSPPWNLNTGPVDAGSMTAGPGLFVAAGDGGACFGLFAFEATPSDYPYVFWNVGAAQTHYGLLNDITGFSTFSPSSFSGVFDAAGNLWLSFYDFNSSLATLTKLMVSGAALTLAATYTYSAFPLAVVYDHTSDEIVSLNTSGLNNELSVTRFAASNGAQNSNVQNEQNFLDTAFTPGWSGGWINSSAQTIALSERNQGEGGIPVDAPAGKGIVNLALTDTSSVTYIDGPKESDFGGFLGWWPSYLISGRQNIWAFHDTFFNAGDPSSIDLIWYSMPGSSSASIAEPASATDTIAASGVFRAALVESTGAADTIDASQINTGRPLWMTIDADSGDSVFPN